MLYRMTLACLLCIVSLPMFAQGIGTWKSFTSLQTATSVAVERNQIVWVGTEGGLYRFNRATRQARTFTNTEGLVETRVTALKLDRLRNQLWIGYESGAVSVLDTENETFTNYLDLARVTQFPSRTIRDFSIQSDSVFVASDFGISLLVPSRREFRESYTRLGALPSGTRVNAVLLSGTRLVAATVQGVATASLTSRNLVAPTEWTAITAQGRATSLAEFQREVVVGTERGVFSLIGTTLQPRQDIGAAVISLSANSATLAVLTSDALILQGSTGEARRISGALSQASSVAIDDQSGAFISDRRQSLIEFNGTALTSFAPNSPLSNRFEVVAIDAQSRVWGSSSATSNGAAGFYRLSNGQWRNFTNINSPNTAPANQFSAVVTRNGKTFVSTWGSGLLEFDETDAVRVYNRSNSDFVGIRTAENFVVLPSMATSETGSIWIANLLTALNPIYEFLPNGQIRKYGTTGFGDGREFPRGVSASKIALDASGRKWIAMTGENDGSGRGVVVFDDNLTPENIQDDRWILLDERSGFGALPNNRVNDIQVDADGALWLATDRGAAYFFDGGSVLQQRIPNATNVFDLRNEFLTSLAIDVLNRKWFGSQNGVWVMNADGTRLLERYTVDNSPLLSNNVRSVAYDRRTGVMYFGTDRGLSSLTTNAVEPRETFGTLKIFPNPYRAPSTTRLTIEGLTRNAFVRIVTVSGALVRELPATGGSIAEWDGKDKNGNDVASGIYIAVAISEDGRESALGKIAVIRR